MSESAAPVGRVVGIDIGGANLKYCDVAGNGRSTSFPLWRTPELLGDRLVADLDHFRPISELAITMTGELADCFPDRQLGVNWIVDHALAAASRMGIRDAFFYGTDGEFHSGPSAKAKADGVAAANWHALASFAASAFPDASTLIDIGSTTTDIIPLAAGSVATAARTDYERLVEGSLVYVGCRRTPVCSLVDHMEFRGQACPVMNEVFATVDDALLLLARTPEDLADCDTADHQPRTSNCAVNRIARMIGLDRRSVTAEDAKSLAAEVISAARLRIADAFQRIHRPGTVIIAGHGDELLQIDSNCPMVRLSSELGSEAARCGPSYAVATLYERQASGTEIRCGG